MAGILSFQEYLGGPDSVQIEQIFPSTQKSYLWEFDADITGWTITADYQTIVVDTVAFNRYTGEPNFSKSSVIGSFDKQEITGAAAPQILDAALGRVKINIPANMYSGPIIPDARQNVPITVVAITWQNNASPAQVNTQRWAYIQCWEPDVAVGDPTTAAGYTALTVGA